VGKTVLTLGPRFRGKTQRMLTIYRAFLEEPHKGLHPQQIARLTGMSMLDVVAGLDGTPELFIKLPKRNGLTRYRMTARTAVRTPKEIEAFVTREARRETWLLCATGLMVLFASLIVIMLMGPAL
jgi:hypothetical protein